MTSYSVMFGDAARGQQSQGAALTRLRCFGFRSMLRVHGSCLTIWTQIPLKVSLFHINIMSNSTFFETV